MKATSSRTIVPGRQRAANRRGRGFNVPIELIVIAGLVIGACLNALQIVLG